MTLFIIIVLVIVGFVLIVKGGDMFVDGAVAIAKVTKIPELLIGATIVSIGTTLPEFTVSLMAAIEGDASLAISNAIGSMLCNVALILGIALALTTTLINKKSFMSKMVLLIFNCILLIIFTIDLKFSPFELITLLLIFVVFMFMSIKEALNHNKANKLLKNNTVTVKDPTDMKPLMMAVNLIIGGVAIFFGARFLVDNVSKLAVDYLNISTAVVGFTIVAFGTSLPELVTAINAVKKKSINLSIGNVLGANVLNGSLLTGLSSLIGSRSNGFTLVIPESQISVVVVGIVALFISVVILIVPIIIKSKTSKWQGFALLFVYVAYLVFLSYSVF